MRSTDNIMALKGWVSQSLTIILPKLLLDRSKFSSHDIYFSFLYK